MNRRGFLSSLLVLPAFLRPRKQEEQMVVKKCLCCRTVIEINTDCKDCMSRSKADDMARRHLYEYYYDLGRLHKKKNGVTCYAYHPGAVNPELVPEEDWSLCDKCYEDIQWWT